jgi:hypothetical protein
MTTLADLLLQQPLYGDQQQGPQNGTSTAPVQSWTEGLNRSLQGGLFGLSNVLQMQQRADANQAWLKMLQQFKPSTPATPDMPSMGGGAPSIE